MKKALAIMITLSMILCLVPAFALFSSAEGAVEIGSAADLAEFIAKINSGEYAADTDAILTASFSLEAYNGTNSWTPIKVEYKGTFDGNGNTISGLTYTRTIANNDTDKADTATLPDYYQFIDGGDSVNCFGLIAYGVLAYQFSGTLKNVTFKDIAYTVNATFNKNMRMDVGGIIGLAKDGAVIDGVTLKNIDLSVNNDMMGNQGNTAGMAALAGRTQGEVTIKNVSLDADSSINAASCGRMDVGQIIGVIENGSTVSYKNLSGEATLTEMASDNSWSPAPNWNNNANNADYRVDGVIGGMYAAIGEQAEFEELPDPTETDEPSGSTGTDEPSGSTGTDEPDETINTQTGDLAAITIAAVAVISFAGAATVASKRKIED